MWLDLQKLRLSKGHSLFLFSDEKRCLKVIYLASHLFFCLRASIDCVKLINEEHFVSGSQDGYVALLITLPSNKQFGYVITAATQSVTCLLLQFLEHLAVPGGTLGSTRWNAWQYQVWRSWQFVDSERCPLQWELQWICLTTLQLGTCGNAYSRNHIRVGPRMNLTGLLAAFPVEDYTNLSL